MSPPFKTFKLVLIADQTYFTTHTNTTLYCSLTLCRCWFFALTRVVIIFIIIKIFFYVCWYRSRQRQLAAYLSNPRNAQIVIVGGRAFLHHSVSADTPNLTRTLPLKLLKSASQTKLKQVCRYARKNLCSCVSKPTPCCAGCVSFAGAVR